MVIRQDAARDSHRGAGTWRQACLLLSLAMPLLACASAAPTPIAETTAKPERPQDQAESKIRPHLALPPRAFTDRLGTVLEFVPVKVKGEAAVQALVRLTGVDEPLAGVPLLATRRSFSEVRNEWTVRYAGYDMILISTVTRSMDRDVLFVSLPETGTQVKVVLDPKASTTIDFTEVIASHELALASGQIARLERYDREGEIARMEASLARELAKLQTNCGGALTSKILWDSVSNEELKEQVYCTKVASSFSQLCQSNENTGADVLSKVKEIACVKSEGLPLFAISPDGVLQVSQERVAQLSDNALLSALTLFLEIKPTVVKSKEGVYITISSPAAAEYKIYAGFVSNMQEQSITAGYASSRHRLWHANQEVFLERKNKRKWEVSCSPDTQRFEEVGREERDTFLAAAKWQPPVWRHTPVVLARDGLGTYYYVDRLTDAEGGLGHRWYRGPRGAAKSVKVVDVINDPGSLILVSGRERLEIRRDRLEVHEVTLFKGKRAKKLQLLTLHATKNIKFIYTDLGAYAGEDYGGICNLKAPVQP